MAKGKSVLEKLLDLEPELEAELADPANHSSVVRTPLLNALGAISHLRDSIATDEHLVRP